MRCCLKSIEHIVAAARTCQAARDGIHHSVGEIEHGVRIMKRTDEKSHVVPRKMMRYEPAPPRYRRWTMCDTGRHVGIMTLSPPLSIGIRALDVDNAPGGVLFHSSGVRRNRKLGKSPSLSSLGTRCKTGTLLACQTHAAWVSAVLSRWSSKQRRLLCVRTDCSYVWVRRTRKRLDCSMCREMGKTVLGKAALKTVILKSSPHLLLGGGARLPGFIPLRSVSIHHTRSRTGCALRQRRLARMVPSLN